MPKKTTLKKIDLGYSPIRVVHEAGMAECGSFDAARQTVGIFREQLPADQLNVLMHELTHVVAQRYHLDLEDKVEEHLAQVFGNAWAELFIRNPDVIAWIAEKAKKVRRGDRK